MPNDAPILRDRERFDSAMKTASTAYLLNDNMCRFGDTVVGSRWFDWNRLDGIESNAFYWYYTL